LKKRAYSLSQNLRTNAHTRTSGHLQICGGLLPWMPTSVNGRKQGTDFVLVLVEFFDGSWTLWLRDDRSERHWFVYEFVGCDRMF
jgi:hypothetical protein